MAGLCRGGSTPRLNSNSVTMINDDKSKSWLAKREGRKRFVVCSRILLKSIAKVYCLGWKELGQTQTLAQHVFGPGVMRSMIRIQFVITEMGT